MKAKLQKKIKDCLRKTKLNPFGGGVLFLISLSLVSGGLASFLITDKNIQAELNGVVNVGSVESIITLDDYSCFTICVDGFIDENGVISNTGYINYSLKINTNAASNLITNNTISIRTTLSENSGYFINKSSPKFDFILNNNNSTVLLSYLENEQNTLVSNIFTAPISENNIINLQYSLIVTENSNLTGIVNNFGGDFTAKPNFSLIVEGIVNE